MLHRFPSNEDSSRWGGGGMCGGGHFELQINHLVVPARRLSPARPVEGVLLLILPLCHPLACDGALSEHAHAHNTHPAEIAQWPRGLMRCVAC